ncbi:MAG: hypothetical protein GX957_09725 [Clostridiaceae bacterium]|nr:hypothetical protein [Clostridiaceae bacterium]
MKNIIIFGAGQSGRMIKKLLHGTCKSIFYMDNNYKNLPDFIDEIPVVSPKELTNIRPDKIIISVLNKEAAEEIHLWLIDEGIRESDILNIGSLTKLFDIRLSTLRLLSEEINEKKVEGNVAELGVYKGYLARELNLLFKDRKLYLFDTFTGFDARDIEYEKKCKNGISLRNDFSDTNIQQVKSKLPYPEKAIFCIGYFPDSAANIEDKFALVSLDTDLYLSTLNGLKYFYPRLSKGGCILLHDYNSTQFPNVKAAVNDFSKESNIRIIPLSDLHGSAVIV